MTQKEFYEREVEFLLHEIEFDNSEIEWCNRMILMERKEEKKTAEYVWSKGVLTEIEKKIWGNPKKILNYERMEYERQRSKYYRRRKKDEAELKRIKALLETL